MWDTGGVDVSIFIVFFPPPPCPVKSGDTRRELEKFDGEVSSGSPLAAGPIPNGLAAASLGRRLVPEADHGGCFF